MRESRQKRIAVDLFAGCGGTTLGIRMAGFTVRAAVEVDPIARRSFRLNRRGIPILGDIREVTGHALLNAARTTVGELDLLAACPPCQGLSAIRTRNGGPADDPRNDLIGDVERLVRDVRPRAVMLENVPQLLHDPRFRSFVSALDVLGYSVSYEVINAAELGLPQRRARLVLAAVLGAPVSLAGLTVRSPARNVREAIGGLPEPGGTGDPLHDLTERRSTRVLERIRAIPIDGGSRADLPDDLQLACHVTTDGFRDVYGRMSWNAPAPTITGGCINPSKGRFLHPDQDRAITLREAALLQGFPPRFSVSLARGKYAAAGLIGNAFPPPFAEAIARRIRDTLDRDPERRLSG